MTKPGQEYTTEVKHKAFEFRAQGLSLPEVAQRLQAELGMAVPHKTLVWWSRTPDAKAMIAELRPRTCIIPPDASPSRSA
jgi:intein-encoded DNA endonuclease-like protein